MNAKDVHSYYSREDVQNAMLKVAKDREVAGVFRSGSFSQRPNVVLYPNDITAMARTGIIEFHCSLERWTQPMALKQDNYGKLRKGWDLILDIDCKLFEHGKIASEAFIWGLKKHDIKEVSLKFTGGTGFHIGIPWESFPDKVDYKPTSSQYPDLARKIVEYLKEFVRERFEDKILKKFSPEELSSQVNKPLNRIFAEEDKDSENLIDPYQVVEVDSVLVSPRHLFRMPYSLNKKTFLVSLPIKPKDLDVFEKMDAKPDNIKAEVGFLDKYRENEAELLIAESIDWNMRVKRKEKRKAKQLFEFKKALHPDKFPPCVKNILKGLPDGRKRSVFILLNFLRSVKWNWEDIDTLLSDWNLKNSPPLRENYIRSQIRWHKTTGKNVLPPNCEHEGWFKDFGICKPDELCKTIKNPVNYAVRSLKRGKRRTKKTARKK